MSLPLHSPLLALRNWNCFLPFRLVLKTPPYLRLERISLLLPMQTSTLVSGAPLTMAACLLPAAAAGTAMAEIANAATRPVVMDILSLGMCVLRDTRGADDQPADKAGRLA
jgi:hypothetical protein